MASIVYIINLFKEKGDALSCENYRGLKLKDQVTEVLEHILNTIIWVQVSINNMLFGFMPGRDVTDAIFILRQLQEKSLHNKKTSTFHLLILKHFIVYHILFFGGQCENLEWMNGLFRLFGLCMKKPIRKSELPTAKAHQLMFQLVSIKDLY